MRFAYLGNFDAPWETESYIARALERQGHSVKRLHEPHTSLGATIEAAEHADVLLFAKARFMGRADDSAKELEACLDGLKESGTLSVCWLFDLMDLEFNADRWSWINRVADLASLVCLTDGYSVRRMQKAGRENVRTLRQGCPDDVRPGVAGEKRYDVLFLGLDYGDRSLFAREMRRVFGDGFLHVPQGVRGGDLADLMATCEICVAPPTPFFPGYWSNRIYVVTGYGGLLMHPSQPSLETDGWVDEANYIGYQPWESPSGIAAILQSWLRPELREHRRKIREAGQRHAMTMGYDQRVTQLVSYIKEIRHGLERREV